MARKVEKTGCYEVEEAIGSGLQSTVYRRLNR